MMHPGLLAALAFCYLLLLFAVARFGDAHREGSRLRSHATIYPLSLAIYCTTWTFFGSVGLAASSGLSFLTIYIGPILVMTVGFPVLKKVISLSKQQRITSVADFLGARYGKSVRVAAVATIICVVGTVPYIALQLKAVSTSLSLLISPGGVAQAAALPVLGDFSLFIVVVLAVFTILFGTRHADATEHQDGLMLAIALESAIKLAAFLIVGIFITWFMFGGLGDLYAKAAANEHIQAVVASGIESTNLIVLTVLSTLAFMLLPRQFHVAVVENYSERELNRARWLFPLYLVLINLFVLPIAAAGILTFGDQVNGDHFVLALPETTGNVIVAALAFLGGLSAGTAMVIVACVALAIMISNHLVLPAYLRGDGYDIREDPTDMEQRILVIRRTAITLVLLLAYAYYKAADNSQALASIGLVSFAAAAQLAPAFFGGLFWRGANARGAIAGMVLGLVVWAYTLLLPTIAPEGVIFGLQLFSTERLIDLDLSPLANGVLWSLSFNTIGFVLGSFTRRASSLEDHQATVFVAFRTGQGQDVAPGVGLVTVGQINTTLARYLGRNRARRAFERYWQEAGYQAQQQEPASANLIRYSEETLASAIGSSSSRLVHSLLLQRYEETSTTNLQLLDEATAAIQYNQSLLRTAFDQLDQGITVFDADNRLSFWNKQFRRLLNLPESIGQAGTPLSVIVGEIAAKHRAGPEDTSFDKLEERVLVPRRTWGLALPRLERILEIRTSTMPDGGIVIAWNDVTERMMFAEALKEANESLEKRVEERTRDLVRANSQLEEATREADLANQSKTRFLSAAGHDLLQPLNAARLYTSTLLEKSRKPDTVKLGNNISRSLESVEEILGSVLAISRLDTTSHKLSISGFPLQRLLDQIEIEFRPLAQEKKLDLRLVPTSLWIKSDPAYMRRLLQNLVSNAIKYTNEGKVLVGCRRMGTDVVLMVADTGIGISEGDEDTIFKEFERLDEGARLAPGLGLGLSIVDRISKALGHDVSVRSVPGKGTIFSIRAPRTLAEYKRLRKPSEGPPQGATLDGLQVLCIDNDPAIVEGMRGLLEHWGCTVKAAAASRGALRHLSNGRWMPHVALVDYHLDREDGLATIAKLRAKAGSELPAVLVTADRSSEIKKQAESAGVPILNKPVKPAALRALLSQINRMAMAAE
ncbi:PAS domain-containing hybrid sensor histidine kinase/response regulator [Salaquimonas pukyongi]|uniref:PAS domain-containing hybrid sensor histidine kinase/response regulator n=1 Tax=Salaquimonas pukyongi TaxID=2712698 RepID=UPI00313BD0DC